MAVQLNTLIAEGTATTKLRNEKTMPAKGDWPDTNMWWPHTRKPMHGDRQQRVDHERVAEDVPAREAGDHSVTTPIAGSIMM